MAVTDLPGEERRPNVLLIVSDQHNPRVSGFAGHPDVLTPHLDALAAGGTIYSSAYCSSPICVPSRASMATGRYVHDLGTWDNAAPYTGSVRSWGHVLGGAGYRVTTIGKLHYRDPSDDTGFPDQRLAMHVHGGGDLRGVSLRPDGRVREGGGGMRNLLGAGKGESEYTRFDRAVADAAVEFFHKEADQGPWALMVSFVAPHFPLIAPDAYYDLYEPGRLTLPGADLRGAWDHPAVDVFKRSFGLTRELTEGETRACLHAYLALCTFLDSRIGLVVEALGAAGRADDTLVVYTSDHGESAGAHGLWFKHLMNEESVGVPLVVAGPGVPSGVSIDTPVSHIDLFPTLVEWAGLAPEDSADLPGISLMDHDALASADRPVLAEYHANGTVSASFMLRHGRYKYVEYVGERPQLFDLERDPFETEDLAGDPTYAEALAACARRMRDICDPAEVDAAAKADQARRVAAAGGLAAAESITVNYTPVPGELGLG